MRASHSFLSFRSSLPSFLVSFRGAPLPLAPFAAAGALGALALLLHAAPAAAQAPPTDAKNVAGARDLATAGMQLQAERRYAECADKFDAAHRLYPEATTVTLRLAQCLAASGRLVEAGEAYRVLQVTPVASNAPAQFKQAQQQGKVEADELEKRIPQLTITVDPTPPPSGTQLHMQHANGTGAPTIDVLDAAWIGLQRRLNPGTYTVFATAPGYASKTKQIAIVEGDKKSEALLLSAGEQAPVVAGSQTKVAGPNEAPAPYVAPPPVTSSPARATKAGLMLGGGGAVAAAGGSDNIGGATGMAHVAAWLRLSKFLLGGVLQYHSLGHDGSERRTNAYYGGVHVGFLTTAEKKVSFWLDGGLGIAGVEGNQGFGAQLAMGPSFPLSRTIRLVTKGILGTSFTERSYAFAAIGVDLQFEIPFGKPAGQQ